MSANDYAKYEVLRLGKCLIIARDKKINWIVRRNER